MTPHNIFPYRTFGQIFILIVGAVVISSAVLAAGFSKEQLFQFGTLAARDGEYEKATDFFKQAIEQDARFAPAYNALGLVYDTWEEGGGPREAIRYFKIAVDIDPAFAECWNNLGRSFYSVGDFIQAERAFKKSLLIKQDQPDTELALGWVYLLGESRADESIEYFEDALEKKDNDMGHYGLGLANLLKGEKFKVLEQITALRHRQKEEQAAKLEKMVRENIQITSTPGTPLITGKEKLESLFEKELAALGKSVDTGEDGKGLQVRLRGPLR